MKIRILLPFATNEGKVFPVNTVHTVEESEQVRQWIESGLAVEVVDGGEFNPPAPPSDEQVLDRLSDAGVPGILFDAMSSEDFLNAARLRKMKVIRLV